MALTVAVAVTFLASSAAPAGAAANRTLARWRMDEGKKAAVMHDSSGHNIDGSIGGAVVPGVKSGGVIYYHWRDKHPKDPPEPQRLIKVDDNRLNPGTRDFAVTIRFRTTRTYGNIIQKGQSGAPGGYFKWQIPKGKLTCLFRGRSPSGAVLSRAVNSGGKRLNDGRWHKVRCERTAKRVTMTVDGRFRRSVRGATGRIHNDVPLTIAGKRNCDQVQITCDYFVGDIASVVIQTG